MFLESTGLCCLEKLVWILWSAIQMNLLCHPFSLNPEKAVLARDFQLLRTKTSRQFQATATLFLVIFCACIVSLFPAAYLDLWIGNRRISVPVSWFFFLS